MKKFYSICITGLLAVLPLVLTLYLLIWLVSGVESLFSVAFDIFLPQSWYIPGMGVVLAIASIYFIGLVLQLWVFQQFQSWLDQVIEKFPLVGDIYESFNSLMKYFAGGSKLNVQEQVVIITMGTPPMRLLGIVTRSDLDDAPSGLAEHDTVAVYLPMSYQVGGYT
ncbi:MAG TPA: DUF502 domain-containing protein, partial [Gammaproteobacteria bacterium]|nr:DUF502 domain-containing protein [Gammaproteobacteria bacterium]